MAHKIHTYKLLHKLSLISSRSTTYHCLYNHIYGRWSEAMNIILCIFKSSFSPHSTSVSVYWEHKIHNVNHHHLQICYHLSHCHHWGPHKDHNQMENFAIEIICCSAITSKASIYQPGIITGDSNGRLTVSNPITSQHQALFFIASSLIFSTLHGQDGPLVSLTSGSSWLSVVCT